MMYDLATFMSIIGLFALAAVYLVAKDQELRDRAWQLLKLLFRR